MSLESKTLRDLFAIVITGNTVNMTSNTATDFMKAVIDESGSAIRVNLNGGTGGSGTSGTSGVSGTSGTSGGGGSSSYTIVNSSDASVTGTTLSYYRLSGTTQYFLPSASSSGDWIKIKNLYGTLNVYPDGNDTIDGTTSKTINLNDGYEFIDGTTGNWDIQ